MISRDTIQKIQDAVKIEEVISDFVTLKRRGASFVACCPFHNEKTPSFHVSPSKGIFKCFGCGKSGSAISFVMEHEHYSYTEALKYLAQKYHIEVVEEELSAEEIVARQKRESLQIVMDFAHSYYKSQLSTPEGKSVAMAYFHSRGMEDVTIEKEGLGWAPSGRRSFTDAALAAGYKEEYLLELNLSMRTEDGSLIDRFRERVMFPIYSLSGKVIAFSGRTLKAENKAKYVNSNESELYVKSRSLLGIYQAKGEISKQDKCFLVEGNIDVITMHQLGIMNVVASCGTALTIEQIRLIRKFTSNLTIMYDGDKAGIKAAMRGMDMVLEEGMNVRLVLLPEGQDPDDFGRHHTLKEFQDFIAEHETDFVEYKTSMLMASAGKDPILKAGVINDIADTIAKIPDPVIRSVYVQECSTKFDLEEKILFERIAKVKNGSLVSNKPQEDAFPEKTYWTENSILSPVEKDVLGFLLRFGEESLVFEFDSKYYSEEPLSVADFIVNSLEEYHYQFANSVFAGIYADFLKMYYDNGLSCAEIVRRFLDGENRSYALAVGDIAVDKDEITVSRFRVNESAKGSWLAHSIPNLLSNLVIKDYDSKIAQVKAKITQTQDRDEQLALLSQIVEYQKAKRNVENNKK